VNFVNELFGFEDERTLNNYLIWKLIEAEISELPSFRDIYMKYRVWPRDEPPSHAAICGYHLANDMPFVAGRIYADYYKMTSEDLDELNTYIGVTLSAWQGMITGVKWMSQQSKDHAINKIRYVARNVAYPQWIMNNAALDAYYANLNISMTDDPFVAVNKKLHFQAWDQLRVIGATKDRNSWFVSPAIVNAFYMPVYNSITFPAAIMRPPVFNKFYPKSYNFGMIGAIMGHELGHAFDSGGVYWDEFGAYVNQTWMDPASRAEFDKNGSVHCGRI